MTQEQISQIKELKDLLDSGALSKKEFEDEKQKILSSEHIKDVDMSKRIQLSTQSSWENNLKTFVDNCSIENDALSWFNYGKGRYVSLLFILTICLSGTLSSNLTLIADETIIAILFAIAMTKTKGIMPKIVLTLMLIIPIVCTFSVFGDTPVHIDYLTINRLVIEDRPKLMQAFLSTLVFVLVFNLLVPSKIAKKERVFGSLSLLTLANPTFWALFVVCKYVHNYDYSGNSYTFYYYNDFALWAFVLSSLFAYIIIKKMVFGSHCITTSNPVNLLKKTYSLLISHKKIVLGLIVAIFFYMVGSGIKSYLDRVAREKALIEKFKQDSLNAIEKQEQKRKAAIVRAEREARERAEQVRLDSIEKAEHQGFVKKMENIGLIITDVRMVRGEDKDGDPTKGVSFSVYNPTNKTIKYVIAYVSAVNSVGDVMSYQKGCRGIGPISPHETGSWEFEDVFYDKNDVIDDLSGYFTVIYSNGSSKKVRIKDAYVDFERKWFE